MLAGELSSQRQSWVVGETRVQSWLREAIRASNAAAARPWRLRRCANPRQLPHEQPEIEAADMHEHTLQDVGMPAQMHPAHAPDFVEMRIGAFEPFTALAQQPLPAGAPNPPTIGIHRVRCV